MKTIIIASQKMPGSSPALTVYWTGHYWSTKRAEARRYSRAKADERLQHFDNSGDIFDIATVTA